MSIIEFSGNEAGNYRELNPSTHSSQAVLSNGYARTGRFSLRAKNATLGGLSHADMGIPSSDSGRSNGNIDEADLWVRVYYMPEILPENFYSVIFQFAGVSDPKMSVCINTEGQIEVYDTNFGSLVATSEYALVPFQIYRVEAYCGTGITGDYEVRVDGETWLSGTADLSTDNTMRVVVGKGISNPNEFVIATYDDIMFRNDDWPGPGRVYALRPNSSGNYAAWTDPVSWEDIRKPSLNTSTYVSNNSGSNTRISFGLDSCEFEGVAGGIVAVTFTAWMISVGGSNTVNLFARSGGTDHDYSSSAVSTLLTRFKFVTTVDPTDSQPWTREKLDSLEIGIRHVSGANQLRLFALHAHVATEVLE